MTKGLAARSFTVLIGSRDLEHGETAAKSVGVDARAPTRRHESGLHRSRGRAHSERTRVQEHVETGASRMWESGQFARGGQLVMVGSHLDSWIFGRARPTTRARWWRPSPHYS
jgi:hypothetical protein